MLGACFTLSACHLLRELAATGVTQTVRLARLVDMTTSLLRHREHAAVAGPMTDDDIVPTPRKPGLPPHVLEMIRRLYGVELTVKEATEGDQRGSTKPPSDGTTEGEDGEGDGGQSVPQA